MISDRTLGQMMWLGNNDFAPITFDWGNGPLSGKAFKRHIKDGREPCGDKREPALRDKCQTQAGVEWIKDNPKEFAERVPLRIAQMLNPHSFLTRHIRWGYWLRMPRIIDESLVLINVFWNLMVMWGGTLGLIVYGRKAREILIGGILVYHIAAISLLAGLTRYRVPLEPLLMLYLAWAISRRKDLWADMKGRKIFDSQKPFVLKEWRPRGIDDDSEKRNIHDPWLALYMLEVDANIWNWRAYACGSAGTAGISPGDNTLAG